MSDSRRPGEPMDTRPAGPMTDDLLIDGPAEPALIDPSGDPVMPDEPPTAAVFTDVPEAPAGEALPIDEALPPGAGATAARDLLAVLDVRPTPGQPRAYHFPRFERHVLANGLTLLSAHLPGRPLLNAQLVFRGGASVEPAERSGVTVLAARALTEGTEEWDAIELIEATERLGADLDAEAGWDSLVAGVSVPRSRFAPALELLAEVVLCPSFPEAEVLRLRDERMNDLMQARAEPRRRIERVFPETIYAASAPYSRPLGGTELTVPAIDREALQAAYWRLADPASAVFVVAGDLQGLSVVDLLEERFGGSMDAAHLDRDVSVEAHPEGRRVVVVDRPGSPQSEIRMGHLGVARSIPDFHALSVLNTILGGQFGSRLNQLLREERGYTYGVHTSFDMRRSTGPFVVRMAVQTEVTVPAITETLAELRRIGEGPVEQHELDEARDYLVGVFPLRFEAAPQVAAAIAGLAIHELPDDELDRYRPAIAAISADDVLAAARSHVRPDEASVVVVGDAAQWVDALRDAGIGEVIVLADEAGAAGNEP
ncbi:MAG: insulinase family protein, partial [Chloroflexota bacterium]|nr:insulinase family protein [Chloroflexota bacterium]